MYHKLIFGSFIPRIFGADAIVLYPFVFFSEKDPKHDVIYHELIHLCQIKRLGVFRFYWSYLKEYFQLRLDGNHHAMAYYMISFEKEAFDLQDSFNSMSPDLRSDEFFRKLLELSYPGKKSNRETV